MYHFTKEELEDLRDCIHAACLFGKINPQTPLRIKNKIQSMIDNYQQETPFIDITLSDGTKIKCQAIVLGGGGGPGGSK